MKNFIKLLIIVATLFTLFTCKKEPDKYGTIEIKVVNRIGEPIAGATVTMAKTNQERKTSADGIAKFDKSLPIGWHTFTAEKIPEYEPNSKDIEIKEGDNKTEEITLTLAQYIEPISTVVLSNKAPSKTFILFLKGEGEAEFKIENSNAWFDVSPKGKKLDANQPELITVTLDKNTLQNKDTLGSFLIRFPKKESLNKTISVRVSVDQPILDAEPKMLNFGDTLNTLPLIIKNTGERSLEWEIPNTIQWLEIKNSHGQDYYNGTITTETMAKVTVDRSKIPVGPHCEILEIKSKTTEEIVQVAVIAEKKLPVMDVTPTTLNFEESLSELSIDIKNIGVGAVNWVINNSIPWINVDPTTGNTPAQAKSTIKITVDRTKMPIGFNNKSFEVSSIFEQNVIQKFTVIVMATNKATPQISCKKENCTSTMAIISAKIISDGGHVIEEKGVCYDKNNTVPNINNTKIKAGSGLGDFSVVLENLSPKTKYNVRAYIKYKNTEYAYSIVDTFTTPATETAPLLKTLFDQNTVSHYSVKVGGAIVNNGGFNTTEEGICYKKITPDNTTPADINDTKINIPLDGKYFLLTGLEQNTTYNIRAYAKNVVGVGYGGDGSTFTTTSLSNDWLQLNYVGEESRHLGFAFSDDTRIYVGGGISDQYPRKDFWMYDPDTKNWSKKKDLLVALRGAVAFWINGKGYVGTGIDATGAATQQFWKYDPVSNQWTELTSKFPGAARANAVAFVIDDKKAYIGTGSGVGGEFYHDFYEFDPITESFSPAGDMGANNKRDGAVAFSINGKGYCGFGFNNGEYKDDLFEFDPTIPTISARWKSVITSGANPPGRRYAVAFAINNMGYIGTGTGEQEFYRDFYKFNGTTSTWMQIANGEKRVVERTQAIGVSANGKGYVGTGRTNSIHLKDFWEYTP